MRAAAWPNRKVSNLVQSCRLRNTGTGSSTDADMLVRPEYFARSTAPFANENMGFVTSIYRALRERRFLVQVGGASASAPIHAAVLLARNDRGPE